MVFDQGIPYKLAECMGSIEYKAGLGGSLGFASDWRPGGCGFHHCRGSATFFHGD